MYWLLRPALRGACRYESLVDGTLSLYDVADLNDAIDVEAENEARYMDYVKEHGGRV